LLRFRWAFWANVVAKAGLVPKTRLDEVVMPSVDDYQLEIGDPWEADTHVGPVRNERQRDRGLTTSRRGLEQGGRVITGGGRSAGSTKAYYLDPTVFHGGHANYDDRTRGIFGPSRSHSWCMTTSKTRCESRMIEVGLSGTVFSSDQERAYDMPANQTGHVGEWT